jgi:hypothetical protein
MQRPFGIGHSILGFASCPRTACRRPFIPGALAQGDLRLRRRQPRSELIVCELDQRFAGKHLVIGLHQHLLDHPDHCRRDLDLTGARLDAPGRNRLPALFLRCIGRQTPHCRLDGGHCCNRHQDYDDCNQSQDGGQGCPALRHD